jgi:hypothetical protein
MCPLIPVASLPHMQHVLTTPVLATTVQYCAFIQYREPAHYSQLYACTVPILYTWSYLSNKVRNQNFLASSLYCTRSVYTLFYYDDLLSLMLYGGGPHPGQTQEALASVSSVAAAAESADVAHGCRDRAATSCWRRAYKASVCNFMLVPLAFLKIRVWRK